eukprot:scaffold78110_cov58-Phaeocystis_antarctica.AAC.4
MPKRVVRCLGLLRPLLVLDCERVERALRKYLCFPPPEKPGTCGVFSWWNPSNPSNPDLEIAERSLGCAGSCSPPSSLPWWRENTTTYALALTLTLTTGPEPSPS